LFISFNIDGNKTEIFLHLSNNLGPGGFSSSFLDSIGSKNVDHVGCDGSSSNEVLLDGMRNRETFIDWNGVSNTISGIADETGGSSVGVKGEDGLDSNIESLALESFEHDGGHLFSVGFWVSWSFGQQDFVLRWINSKLVRKAVIPNLFHLLPFGNNTGLDWVLEIKDTSHFLCFITNIFGL